RPRQGILRRPARVAARLLRGDDAVAPRERWWRGKAAIALGQHRAEPGADLLELDLVLDLVAEQVLYVKHVDDLLAIGRDLGARYLQIETGQFARHLVEEAWTIASIDFDDRVRAACVVVDQDARRDGEDARAAREGGRSLQFDMRLQIAGQHILEGEGEPRELVGAVERAAFLVLHP